MARGKREKRHEAEGEKTPATRLSCVVTEDESLGALLLLVEEEEEEEEAERRPGKSKNERAAKVLALAARNGAKSSALIGSRRACQPERQARIPFGKGTSHLSAMASQTSKSKTACNAQSSAAASARLRVALVPPRLLVEACCCTV